MKKAISRIENNSKCVKSPTEAHFWKVEPQYGPMSRAICKFCREETLFRNSRTDLDKDNIIIKPRRELFYDIGYRKANSRF